MGACQCLCPHAACSSATILAPIPRGGAYLLCWSSARGWDGGGMLRRQGVQDETALPPIRKPSLGQ